MGLWSNGTPIIPKISPPVLGGVPAYPAHAGEGGGGNPKSKI